MNRIMVLKGSRPAMHKLGNIGRKNDDYIRVYRETDTHYIGNFEEGLGFIDVEFKKEDCRQLTDAEIKDLNGKWYSINGNPLYKIYIDKDGNIIKGACIMKKGIIDKVTDQNGFTKHHNFVGLDVQFPEDIEIGQSLMLLTDQGYINTSKVIQLDIIENTYIIYTKNSIYFIS